MPTYSYQCKRCEHMQDVFHGMTVSPRVKCDACGGPCVRLFGAGAGIIFKGSGFYETDYKNKGKKSGSESSATAKKAEAKADANSNGKSEKKSGESKPAASATTN